MSDLNDDFDAAEMTELADIERKGRRESAPEVNGKMIEAAARALFDMESRDDKLVRCELIEAVLWDDVPDGCPAHLWARERAAAVLAAAKVEGHRP